MGKLVVVCVEGGDSVIADAIKAGFEMASASARQAELPPPVEVAKVAQAVSNGTVRKAVRNVRRAVEKETSKAAERVSSGVIFCPIQGCAKEYSKKAWLNQHLIRDHGKEPLP